jgi:hypothetical protein
LLSTERSQRNQARTSYVEGKPSAASFKR